MSTPIETNTEQLQEVLQQVYNLPMAGGGSNSYDLILSLEMPSGESVFDYTFSNSNITVVSGDLQNLISKAEAQQPTKVGVMLKLYYWSSEYRGFAEAEVYVGPYIHVCFNFNMLRFRCDIVRDSGAIYSLDKRSTL